MMMMLLMMMMMMTMMMMMMIDKSPVVAHINKSLGQGHGWTQGGRTSILVGCALAADWMKTGGSLLTWLLGLVKGGGGCPGAPSPCRGEFSPLQTQQGRSKLMLAIWAKFRSRPGLHVRGAAPRSVLVGCPCTKDVQPTRWFYKMCWVFF